MRRPTLLYRCLAQTPRDMVPAGQMHNTLRNVSAKLPQSMRQCLCGGATVIETVIRATLGHDASESS